ncbi:MAG: OadG family protein [Lachnospiraceae bacterium]|nr:OadG family protein [Lachnospiraceae bacterium]
MKKRVWILGLFLISVLGLTACGKTQDPDEAAKEEQMLSTGEQSALGLLTDLTQMQQEGTLDQVLGQTDEIDKLVNGYISGMEEVGEVADIGDAESRVDKKTVIVDIPITGTMLDPNGNAREATVEIIVPEDGSLPDLTVNPKYTSAELMTKAGLNTLLGMGVTFAILILISLIISSFTLIGKVGSGKKKEESPSASSVDNAVRQIVAGEEQSDDTELIAVISAAIAAYEAENGYVSADGVVIRSIRKINKSKWQNA